jgi:hypothetical protein
MIVAFISNAVSVTIDDRRAGLTEDSSCLSGRLKHRPEINVKPSRNMEGLSKTQHDEYATAFAILALYDGGVRSFSG